MADAQPVFYKSSRRRYPRELVHAKDCAYRGIVNYGGHSCRFDASLLLRLQRALLVWGRYLGRCPRLYASALSARADGETIPIRPKMAVTIPVTIARNEKAGL